MVRPGFLYLCAAAWLALAGQAHAAPPFDSSTLTPASQGPVEGRVYTYTLVVRNTGDTRGGVIEIHLPPGSMLAGLDGLDSASKRSAPAWRA